MAATWPLSCFPKFQPKIVVVGAGVSGVAAAEKLIKNGFENVTLLEARDRIGGRLFTVTTEDAVFEAGATWIHGKEGNLLYNLLDEEEIKAVDWDYIDKMKNAEWFADPDFFQPLLKENTGLQAKTKQKLVNAFVEHMDIADDICNDKTFSDTSKNFLEVLLREWGSRIVPLCENESSEDANMKKMLLQSALRIFMLKECADIGCSPLTDSPSNGFLRFNECPGYDAVIPSGYSNIITPLLKAIPSKSLLLNCEVTAIQWDSSKKNEMIKKCRSPPVTITYTNKKGDLEQIEADHTIVTIPLGCLKANHAQLFHPSLPKRKIMAIENLGYGVLEKIVLLYDQPFWDSKIKTILLLWETDDSLVAKEWKQDLVHFDVFENETKTSFWLQTWLNGEHGKTINYLDKDEIAKTITSVLRRFMCKPDFPEPKDVHVTKWHTDPYSMGCYTYIAHETKPDDVDFLNEPLPDHIADSPLQILFAGEATSAVHFGTVHGAIETGEREAKRIIEFYSNNTQYK